MNKARIQKLHKLLILGFLLATMGLVLQIPYTSVPLVARADSFKEPFKDFFDYEWWLPGSEYAGKGRQYGKWMVVEMFWDSGVPRQWFEITKVNPITGSDSARMLIDGSKSDVNCLAWQGFGNSPDPGRLPYENRWLNPAYLRFRFRLDEWQTTAPTWRITLGALGGCEYSGLEGQVIIGLEGTDPPHLMMRYRWGSTYDNWTVKDTKEVISATTVSLGVVYTLEIMRYADAVNGEIKVWLDGVEVSDLTVQNIDTSYPGGAGSVLLGSSSGEENGFFSKGGSAGSKCTIMFDDLIVRDQYIGVNPSPITYYNLALDSSPQGETVRVGNHVVGGTPVTIQVPEGTIPKVGVAPTNFDHWEISPDFDDFSSYSETWPDLPLIATVTRAPPPPGQNIGPSPTPALYSDTRITAMYMNGEKHTLDVTSLDVNFNPVATSFTVDGLDYTTPWSDSLTKGTHTIAVPSTFTIGEEKYDFQKWEDDSTNPTRTVDLTGAMDITAYYDVTIIPEFPTSIAWLAVITVATLVIMLGARKLKAHSRNHRHLHSE